MKILSKLNNTGMIDEVADKRYVTDAEKLIWNSKSDTDTVTTINGKTGAISKADIVALGISEQGPKGDKGDTGEQGIQGPKGDKGDSPDIIPATADTIGGIKVGSGLLITEDGTLSVDKSQIHEVPAGGEVNQIMKKMSGTDYDYGWGDSVIIEAYGSSLTIS